MGRFSPGLGGEGREEEGREEGCVGKQSTKTCASEAEAFLASQTQTLPLSFILLVQPFLAVFLPLHVLCRPPSWITWWSRGRTTASWRRRRPLPRCQKRTRASPRRCATWSASRRRRRHVRPSPGMGFPLARARLRAMPLAAGALEEPDWLPEPLFHAPSPTFPCSSSQCGGPQHHHHALKRALKCRPAAFPSCSPAVYGDPSVSSSGGFLFFIFVRPGAISFVVATFVEDPQSNGSQRCELVWRSWRDAAWSGRAGLQRASSTTCRSSSNSNNVRLAFLLSCWVCDAERGGDQL